MLFEGLYDREVIQMPRLPDDSRQRREDPSRREEESRTTNASDDLERVIKDAESRLRESDENESD